MDQKSGHNFWNTFSKTMSCFR